MALPELATIMISADGCPIVLLSASTQNYFFHAEGGDLFAVSVNELIEMPWQQQIGAIGTATLTRPPTPESKFIQSQVKFDANGTNGFHMTAKNLMAVPDEYGKAFDEDGNALKIECAQRFESTICPEKLANAIIALDHVKQDVLHSPAAQSQKNGQSSRAFNGIIKALDEGLILD